MIVIRQAQKTWQTAALAIVSVLGTAALGTMILYYRHRIREGCISAANHVSAAVHACGEELHVYGTCIYREIFPQTVCEFNFNDSDTDFALSDVESDDLANQPESSIHVQTAISTSHDAKRPPPGHEI